MGIDGEIRSSPAKAAASVAKAVKRQAAMNSLVADKPVFDQLEEAEARDQKKGSHKRTRTPDETITKQLRVNFNKISAAQATLLVTAEGKNLWDVLKEDQLLRGSNDVNAPKLGKLYYEKLRQ